MLHNTKYTKFFLRCYAGKYNSKTKLSFLVATISAMDLTALNLCPSTNLSIAGQFKD